MHPEGLDGVAPKLKIPDLNTRIDFLHELVGSGKLKEWPAFIDEHGKCVGFESAWYL